MKKTRSKGYNPQKTPAVTIRLQENEGGRRLDQTEVTQLMRKLRRRYGNTDGVEFEFEYHSAESTTSTSS